MKRKLVLSLGSIAVLLTLSGIISMVEYRRMSNHMSELIASNVSGINNSQILYDMTQKYNKEMLSVVMMDDISSMPNFDHKAYMEQISHLSHSVESEDLKPVIGYVSSSFTEFIRTAEQFDNIFLADTVDNAKWFFETLQPKYNTLCNSISVLNGAIHKELKKNTTDFDAGFYRSIIPGVVSMCAALMLVFLLLYYILVYYVNPIYKMASGVQSYRSGGKRYGCDFEGDDQLSVINEGLTDIIDENVELKLRIKNLKEERQVE